MTHAYTLISRTQAEIGISCVWRNKERDHAFSLVTCLEILRFLLLLQPTLASVAPSRRTRLRYCYLWQTFERVSAKLNCHNCVGDKNVWALCSKISLGFQSADVIASITPKLFNETTVKGQKMSKWFFSSRCFLQKKQTKEFNFTTMKPQVDLFLFVFLEEIEDTKKTFRNHLTFKTQRLQSFVVWFFVTFGWSIQYNQIASNMNFILYVYFFVAQIFWTFNEHLVNKNHIK